jgi:hypothetical protein
MRPFAEADLARLAEATVLEHGEDAPIFAHRRAAEQLRSADLAAARHWCVVGRRARQILSRMSLAHH